MICLIAQFSRTKAQVYIKRCRLNRQILFPSFIAAPTTQRNLRFQVRRRRTRRLVKGCNQTAVEAYLSGQVQTTPAQISALFSRRKSSCRRSKIFVMRDPRGLLRFSRARPTDHFENGYR